jgi:hypothetical protein
MANTFQIKRRTTGSAGAPASLLGGELAFNEVDETLYYGAASGVVPIGGKGAFVTLDTVQTVVEDKVFSGAVDLGSAAVTVTQSRTDSSVAVANTQFVQDVASLLDGGSF